MYQVTAPLTQRQAVLITEFKRLERRGVSTSSQHKRRAAIVAELESIEQEKKQRVAA